MNLWDFIILAMIAFAVIYAFRGIRKKKGAGCHGCCADCAGGCAGCAIAAGTGTHQHLDRKQIPDRGINRPDTG